MGECNPILPISISMQTVLSSPGVKHTKLLLSFTRDKDDDDKAAITDLIRTIVTTSTPPQRSAFHVFHLNAVVDLFAAWRRELPSVRPYYAVKCNPHPSLLSTLAALGAGFDCSSRAEIDAALLALSLSSSSGADDIAGTTSIIYANPCKAEPHLEHAAAAGVRLATYDTDAEVAKVARCHPGCELLLRLRVAAAVTATTVGDRMDKYGAHADEVGPLLLAARRAGLTVAGVSFHVGSPVPSSRLDVYRSAVRSARAAFDLAAAIDGSSRCRMRLLDIGGGFTAGAAFEDAAAVIRAALDEFFGDLLPSLEVIAEPGRYFAQTPFTLATRVIGKRARGGEREYWIDDGIYGSLNNVLLDHKVPRPRPLRLMAGAGEDNDEEIKHKSSTVFGPTCDSQDRVVSGYPLPEMSVGDWLVFDDMGAYSTGAGSKFNGFDRRRWRSTSPTTTPADLNYEGRRERTVASPLEQGDRALRASGLVSSSC